MTKTKFKVEILADGSESNNILKAIAAHNSGKCVISLADLISWGVMRSALYSAVPCCIERNEDENHILTVTDNGVKTLIIEEIEIHELEPVTDPNDIADVNI